ncbi:hypothetical protein [Thiocapsa imhoffii]|nr:hypothetical protein [Thiocapsa imhoffii]
MHTGRLVITPREPDCCPERPLVVRVLTETGFIEGLLPGRAQDFMVGPAFLDLISFVGCAVAVSTDAAAGLPFTHVRLPSDPGRPQWCHGRNTRAPRCPRCRTPRTEWRAQVAAAMELGDHAIDCPACGASARPWSWDWRHQGGFGRRLIVVEEVFPGEAMPTPGVLDALTMATGRAWHFFYVQD